jgi:murein endopeptidase
MFQIKPVRSVADLKATVRLFKAYASALGVDLGYQDFATELATLRAQPAVPAGNGCDKSLTHWFADWILRLKIPDASPSPSAKGLTLKDLPPACAAVLNAPASPANATTEDRSEPR